jgi:hypothetical protein
MSNWDPGPDRWKLGFKDAVLASFVFLESYGLQLAQADVTYLRYESPKAFVTVYHGRASYQLHVEIGRHDGPRKDSSLSLDAVLGWRKAPEQKLLFRDIPLFHSDTREGVQSVVPQMAALFGKYADCLLRADEESFKSFDEYCTIGSLRLGEHYRKGTTRWNADMAWNRKDWQQVVMLYDSIGGDLSQTEAAELAYAKEQLRSSASNSSPALSGHGGSPSKV